VNAPYYTRRTSRRARNTQRWFGAARKDTAVILFPPCRPCRKRFFKNPSPGLPHELPRQRCLLTPLAGRQSTEKKPGIHLKNNAASSRRDAERAWLARFPRNPRTHSRRQRHVDVIGSYLPLKRAGANFTAPARFTRKRHPVSTSIRTANFPLLRLPQGRRRVTFVKEYEKYVS